MLINAEDEADWMKKASFHYEDAFNKVKKAFEAETGKKVDENGNVIAK